MRYSVLSFDLDGTLVDTAAEIAEAANRTLADFGVARQPEALVARFIGAGTREMMLRLLAHVLHERSELAPRLPPDDVLERLKRHYGVTAGMSARPYDGVPRALQTLLDSGVRLACVTNKEHRYALRVLERTRLDRYFSLVVGGDSLPVKKPHAGVLQHVVRVLGGQPERAAHVGDSQTDMDAARAAGVQAWAVPYGYNEGRAIETAAPQRLFRSAEEVAAHVLQANARHALAA